MLFETADCVIEYINKTNSVVSVEEFFNKHIRYNDCTPDPYQIEIVNYINTRPVSYVHIARQMGATSTLVSYALYAAITSKKQVLFVTPNTHSCYQTKEYAVSMFKNLKIDVSVNIFKNLLTFSNRSAINIQTAESAKLDHHSYDVILLDSCECYSNSTFVNLKQRLNPCDQVVFLFSNLEFNGSLKQAVKNSTNVIRIPWNLNQRLSTDFESRSVETLGREKFDYNYNCKVD